MGQSMLKAVLFDLDGTLADTAQDLCKALNIILKKAGLPEQSFDAFRPIAGDGAGAFVQLGFGIDSTHPDFARLRQEYLTAYDECCDKNPQLFDNIDRLIRVLVQNNIRWGIVTNKGKQFTHRVVSKLGFSFPPEIVVSGDTLSVSKPHPEPLLYAAQQLAINPQECAYVGDSLGDIQAANAAGMISILANWGYSMNDTARRNANHIADTPYEVLQKLGFTPFQAA